MNPAASQDRSDFKHKVLGATNLIELIGSTVALKKKGKDFWGLCPFHSEKSGSFKVDPVKQYYYCFGCKEHGNAIDFVMKRDRLDFVDALKLLAEAAGLEMPRYGVSKEKAGERQALFDANAAAAMHFEKQLHHPQLGAAGRAYLQQRGFSEATIKQFRIGLAPEGWDHLLRSPLMSQIAPELLHRAGLVKAREAGSGFYDTFRNRIMFPIRDESGRTIAFGGRVMPGDDSGAKYLNSPETPLFNKSETLFGLDLGQRKIIESQTVAIVEGYTDVVMSHQYGAINVVAVLGTGMTERHLNKLRRYADRPRIVLLFDPDAAGDKAVKRVVELFLGHEVELAIATLPDELDPDEFLMQHGLAAFERVLTEATDVLTYSWRVLEREFRKDAGDLTGQQAAVREYLELLANARGSGPVDALRWGQALTRVSRLTEIPVQELHRQFRMRRPAPGALKNVDSTAPIQRRYGTNSGPINRNLSPTVNSVANPQDNANNISPQPDIIGEGVAGSETVSEQNLSAPQFVVPRDRLVAERWILGVLLVDPHRWLDVQTKVVVDDFLDARHRQIAEVYWDYQRHEGEPVFNELLDLLGHGPGSAATDRQLSALAVELHEAVEHVRSSGSQEGTTGAASMLEDSIRLIEQTKRSESQRKLFAELRRKKEGGGTAASTDEHALFEAFVKNNLSTNVRRLGSLDSAGS